MDFFQKLFIMKMGLVAVSLGFNTYLAGQDYRITMLVFFYASGVFI
jgi:hypothetical protein